MLHRSVFGTHHLAYPWELEFNSLVRIVPLEALYQYSPTRQMQKSISSLQHLGFRSVGDLAFMHPDAIDMLSRKDSHRFILRLHTELTKLE